MTTTHNNGHPFGTKDVEPTKIEKFKEACDRLSYTLYRGSGPGDWWTYCPNHESEGLHDPSLHVTFHRMGQDTEDVGTWCFLCKEGFYEDLMYGDAVKCTAKYQEKPETHKQGKLYGSGALLTAWEIHTEEDYLRYGRQVALEDEGRVLHVANWWLYNDGEFIKAKWSNGKYTWLSRSSWIRGAYWASLNSRSDEVELYGASKVGDTDTVWLVEGEKDVETLQSRGLAAVSYHTVGDRKLKWDVVAGRNVVLLSDNDVTGRDYERDVKAEILASKARTLTVVPPFGELDSKCDVSDWIHGGGTRAALEEMVAGIEPLEIVPDETSTANADITVDPRVTRLVERKLREIAATRIVEAMDRPPPLPPAFTSLRDLLAEEDEEDEWLIDQLWPKNGRILGSAPAKSGKTTLTGNLVRCLADTVPFLRSEGFIIHPGFDVAPLNGRTIGLLDMEMSRRQTKQWLRDQQIQNQDAIHIESMRGRSWDMRDDRERARWAEKFGELNTGVLFIDPLSPILKSLGIKENDNTAVGEYLWALDALCREAKIDSLFCQHHTGHGEDQRSRGASEFLGWPDAIWAMKRDREDAKSPRSLSVEGRDAYLKETVLNYDPVTRRLSLGSGNRAEARNIEHAEIIAALVAKFPGQSGRQLRALGTDIGTKDGDRHAAIKEAERIKLVHTHSGPRNAEFHYVGASCAQCPGV